VSTVATTTNSTPLGYPTTCNVDRNPLTGDLWACLVNSSGQMEFFKSTDNGVSWATSAVTLTRTGFQELGSIFVDNDGYLHVCYRVNAASQDQIWYRRLNLATLAWHTAEVEVSFPGNGGVAGAAQQGIDMHVVLMPSGPAIVIFAIGTTFGAQVGVSLTCIDVDRATGVAVDSSPRITGTKTWAHTGSGRVCPSLDIEHNGDGKSTPYPNLWVSYGRASMYMQRLAWTGSTWVGPVNDVAISGTFPSQMDQIHGMWTGSAFAMAAPGISNTSKVDVYVRNRANSSTTVYTTPTHTTGVIRSCIATYAPGSVSGVDLRVYAVGTSTGVLYHIDYVSSTATWGSWTVTNATALLGNNQYSCRRGAYGNSHFEILTVTGSGPSTVTDTPQAVAYPPYTPTWVTPQSGSAQDVASSLLLDWQFNDRDPIDTQSAYAVSRQIGAGALNYWRASDSTWQVAEVQNTSGTTSLTLASSWAAASDANYTFKVKVWDSGSAASGYSAAMVVVPSAVVNPAITSPTAAQVLSTNSVTLVWTAAEQTQYRIQLWVTSGAMVYDSGWITDSPTRSVTLPYVLPNNTNWTAHLQTKNLEGLASVDQTRQFTVAYTAPATPTLVATPSPSTGVINVAVTNPAPVGSQPALTSQDVWQRPVTTGQTVMNSNPDFEVNANDWTGVGGTAARSTVQFHAGVASLLVTPTGGIADSYGETSKYPVTSGLYYTAAAWVRATTANKAVRISLRWYTAGGALVSASSTSGIPVATAWQYWQVTDTVPATATQVSIAVGFTSTPAAGDTGYVDEARLTLTDRSAGIRIAAAQVSGVTVADWRAVSLEPTEYQVVALGANGTSIAGPWTT
jgi:hypothetical protein